MFNLRVKVIAFGVALAALFGNGAGTDAQEAVPPLPPEMASEETRTADSHCALIEDLPLTALTVDIYPRDADVNPVQVGERPVDCWSYSGKHHPARFISGGCGGWDCCQLLQLARFYHRPLYFDDPDLERRGEGGAFPAVHATKHFAIDFALLPMRLLLQRPTPVS